jgi:hypothetical protein
MKVSPKSSIYEELFQVANKYFEVLDKAEKAPIAEKEMLKKQLDSLLAEHQDDPAFAAFLKMNRLAQLGKE